MPHRRRPAHIRALRATPFDPQRRERPKTTSSEAQRAHGAAVRRRTCQIAENGSSHAQVAFVRLSSSSRTAGELRHAFCFALFTSWVAARDARIDATNLVSDTPSSLPPCGTNLSLTRSLPRPRRHRHRQGPTPGPRQPRQPGASRRRPGGSPAPGPRAPRIYNGNVASYDSLS